MSLNASKISGGGKPVEAVEAGAYQARPVIIAALGMQKQNAYMGQEKEPAPRLQVVYELLDEFMVDDEGNEQTDRPRWIWEDFPLFNINSERATSTKRYIGLDPELKYGGDWAQLIDTPCMLTVTREPSKKDPNKVYNNVANVSIMRAKDAAKAPPLVNAPLVFDFDDPEIEVFNALPQGLQDKIKGALDFQGSKLEALLEGGSTESTSSDEESGQETETDW